MSSWARACAWARASSKAPSRSSSKKFSSKVSAREAAEQCMVAARSRAQDKIAKQRWAPSLQIVAEDDEPEAELCVVSEPERDLSDGELESVVSEPESVVSEPEREPSDVEPELEFELEEGF